MSDNPYNVRVTEIGEYIRHRSCPRRFKLGTNDELATEPPFAEELFNPLDPILQEKGEKREEEWEELLNQEGLTRLSPAHEEGPDSGDDEDSYQWENFAEAITEFGPGEEAYAREVAVDGIELNGFTLNGQMDFVLLLWEDETPYLRIVETKASRKDKTYHRIQVATYALLVERILASNPIQLQNNTIGVNNIESIVGRINDETEEIEDILRTEPFELSQEKADIEQLTDENNGRLVDIVEEDLDNLQYQLDSKCDSCRFDVHCFPESARQNRLEILGLNTSEIRVLREADIENVDELAELNLNSDIAASIREEQTFDADLETLTEIAQARRQNLPGDTPNDEYELTPLSQNSNSQLPSHEIEGKRLVRVYLNVDYDYTENRVGSLAAHITTSRGDISTTFSQDDDGNWMPDPEVKEEYQGNIRKIQAESIVETVPSPWSGDYRVDTGKEETLISQFFRRLQRKITTVSNQDEAPVHFYVWSDSEMANLVEACSRGGGRLLGQLRELLGCREPTEQLIYSTLQNEVDSRFALGWTSQGLVVATGIRWFGESFHWTREVGGEEVDLTDKFLQNLFDFRRILYFDQNREWAKESNSSAMSDLFEIRSRFFDSLPAPYWRVHWHVLKEPAEAPSKDWRMRRALERYHRSEGFLRRYLNARTEALRWIDEQIRFKNTDIDKPELNLSGLLDYSLDVSGAAEAALNFLDIDYNSQLTEWLSKNMRAPVQRVPSGDTIPLKNVQKGPDGELRAKLNFEQHDIDPNAFKKRTSYGEDSFVRLSPCFEDQRSGQTQPQLRKAGRTCNIESIDWDSQKIRLDPIVTPGPDKFTLASYYIGKDEDLFFDYATIDDSVSDFVAKRVYKKIEASEGNHAHEWFDPENLSVPELEDTYQCDRSQLGRLLESFELPKGSNLRDSQIDAILNGSSSRVHLLHGPPGTGKTTTTAIATLLRTLSDIDEGDIAIVAGNTHTAVTNLIENINAYTEEFQDACVKNDIDVPEIETVRIEDRGSVEMSEGIHRISPKGSVRDLDEIRDSAVTIVGGTVNEILKLDKYVLSGSQTFGGDEREHYTPLLVVDEASMMQFPHFLSLAGLIDERDGMALLAGDHRQLPPILSHDWEKEDRPPVEKYQPYASAFEAVRQIYNEERVTDGAVKMTALEYSFRLPEVIRELVSSAYDDSLEGSDSKIRNQSDVYQDPIDHMWEREEGLFLIIHDEEQSRKSNTLEAKVVEEIIGGADELPGNSVAVVTPHRAQQTLLQETITSSRHEKVVDTVDTVERMQGGECQNVIVSATGSDQTAISDNEEFLLNLNRTNVAFSRAQSRLFVICSRNLLNHIAPEYEDYQSSTLWKSLRELCENKVGMISVDESDVNVLEYLGD